MAIQLENQYILKIDIGNKTDFILPEDFIELLYIESACQMLPMVQLRFILRDLTIFDLINEGNPLVIGIGRTNLELIELRFKLASDQNLKQPNLGQEVLLKGTLYSPKFSLKEKSRTFNNSTSVEVIKKVSSEHFKFITNVSKTNDRQHWRQASSDWDFLKKVAIHSYINADTFVNFCFDSSNCYFYDVRQLFKNPSNIWMFSKAAISNENSNTINFNSSKIVNNFGLHNLVGGYNFKDTLYNLDSYSGTQISPKLKSFSTVDTNYFNILSEDTEVNNFMYKNRNTHDNYDLAKLQNIRNLIISGSVKTLVTFGGQFKKLHLMDIAQFDQESSDYRNSGYQVVSRIIYQISDNRLTTNVVLTREAPNNIKGSLVKIS